MILSRWGLPRPTRAQGELPSSSWQVVPRGDRTRRGTGREKGKRIHYKEDFRQCLCSASHVRHAPRRARSAA